MDLLKNLCKNNKNTFFYKLLFQPDLNLSYYSTILLKWPRISTGMRQWKWYWSMTCDFPYKKNKKRLFLLHIEVDSRNPADNAPIDDISTMVGSVSLWIF